MIQERLKADPFMLERMIGEPDRNLSRLDEAKFSLRMFQIHNDAILRLADEIEKRSLSEPDESPE
jgi:hypothetical protein